MTLFVTYARIYTILHTYLYSDIMMRERGKRGGELHIVDVDEIVSHIIMYST